MCSLAMKGEFKVIDNEPVQIQLLAISAKETSAVNFVLGQKKMVLTARPHLLVAAGCVKLNTHLEDITL